MYSDSGGMYHRVAPPYSVGAAAEGHESVDYPLIITSLVRPMPSFRSMARAPLMTFRKSCDRAAEAWSAGNQLISSIFEQSEHSFAKTVAIERRSTGVQCLRGNHLYKGNPHP
jgi:hypothetical protein